MRRHIIQNASRQYVFAYVTVASSNWHPPSLHPQSGSCSPRAQLRNPSISLTGAAGIDSMASKISFRSELGSCMPPDLVGMPRMGARRRLTCTHHQGSVGTTMWGTAAASQVRWHTNSGCETISSEGSSQPTASMVELMIFFSDSLNLHATRSLGLRSRDCDEGSTGCAQQCSRH
jgi:hypothetical protein